MKRIMVLCLMLALVLSITGCTGNSNKSEEPKDKTVQPSKEVQENTDQDETKQPDDSKAPRDTIIKSGDELGASLSWVNYATEDELFTKAVNFDKMQISSVYHLPLYMCENVEEFESFKEEAGEYLSFSRGYDEVPSFNEVTKDFDKEFFDNNTLFLVYVIASSGSYRYGLDSISIEEDAFTAHVTRVNSPEMGTEDMAGWMVVVPVKKELLQGTHSYTAIME